MHIVAALEISHRLIPALQHLRAELNRKTKAFAKIVKIGRTHTQDATPLTLDQEFSGYAAQVASVIARLKLGLRELYPLAQGGTAIRPNESVSVQVFINPNVFPGAGA